MKKLLVLMGLATAAFSFTGCQKNEMKDADNAFKGTSTFELVADIAQTKTTLAPDTYAVDWEEGDVIYMVTSDETWGAPYADDKDAETIAEFKYADGKFSTTSEIAAGKYTFKAIYASISQKSFHRGASTTHKLVAEQEQDCPAPTAHIKANDALVGTFTATIPMEEVAKVKMAHLYTLMQVDVKNSTGADIEVTKFEMTAAGAVLAGVFNVESFETPSISTKSGASSTITVNVANGAVKAGELLPVYFIMAPLSNYSGDVTFKVTDASGNTYTKTVTLSNMTFAAGKYNTTPYTISSADVVEPEPANVTWDLSINETSEVSETKIAWTSDVAEMYCEKGSATTATNNYYGGNADNRTSTRFYKNSILTIAPKAGYKITSVVFTATSDSYASALSGSTWANASATVNSKVVTVTPTNGAQPVTATIGGTCGFTSVVVYYAENEGGEEPETKTLVSITISGQTTTYTVGDTFEFDGTVTATYSDGTTATVTPTSVSEPDMDAEGTKDVTVTYTEGGVTEETTYQINISAADNTDYSGTYAIVAYRNSESLYYYLTNEQTSSSTVRLVAKSAGNTCPTDGVTLNASKLWNVSKSGSVYTIQSAASNKYVSWNSGNSAIMSETGLQFTVTKQDDGTFNFINGDRYLSLNSAKGSDYFAMYAGTQTQNLYLIKAVEGEEPAPTLTKIEVGGQTTTFTVGDTFKFDGTVTATYSDGTTADVTDYATFSGYDMSSAGDQKVTVSYDGKTCEYQITVKEASTGGDDENTETKYYVKVTSAPTDWSGTYLIVYEEGKIAFDGSLTTLDAVENKVDVTIEDGKIEATDAMKARQFTINASGHIQSASGYYIGQTSDTNGLKSNKTTSYTNTFSLNTDGTVNVVSGGAYLRYNATSGQERFRYYKSSSYTGQKAIVLYKLQ